MCVSGIAQMSFGALAHGLVLRGDAERVQAALDRVARVLALAVVAAQSGRAVRVLVALIGQNASLGAAGNGSAGAAALVRSRCVLAPGRGVARVLGALVDVGASVRGSDESW